MHSSDAILFQKRLSTKVIAKNTLPPKIRFVCGVDVSYKKDMAHCSAVVINKNSTEIVESANFSMKVTMPYIPGLFMLRESKPILKTLKKLKKSFDVLLVDGHGQLHPRQFGLACHIGLIIDKPVIGVAKALLCGKVRSDSKVEYQGKIVGYEIKQKKKKIYVSVGHKINLTTAVRIVKELTLEQRRYPEPLRLADFYSKSHKVNT